MFPMNGIMILGIAAVILVLVSLFNKKKNEKQPSTADKAFEKVEKMEENRISMEKANSAVEDDELIAVISAAVAASLNRSTHNIIVKSVKRIESHSPVWNRIGRQEQIGTRL